MYRYLDNRSTDSFAGSWLTGGVVAPRGFLATGVACGLKKQGKPDLALITTSSTAAVAGVFTRNVVKGHSLQLSQKVVSGKKARAVVINSANANACVGPDGLEDAGQMAKTVADLIGCAPGEVITGSTGVIGQRLDIEKINAGIALAVPRLDNTPAAAQLAEQAILTTDLVQKSAAVTFYLEDSQVTIGAMAKGSGMIYPDMATMIVVITTDADIPADQLKSLLQRAVEPTFNRISVDGDTSVCDMVILLANGQAGNAKIAAGSAAEETFLTALSEVCGRLARQIVADGEGATRSVLIRVTGAGDAKDAALIARAIGRSPLVKTAINGADANWGRILTAAGYAGVDFDPLNCRIYLDDLPVYAAGVALAFSEDQARSILLQDFLTIHLELNEGAGRDHLLTCDFSEDYIRINSKYRS